MAWRPVRQIAQEGAWVAFGQIASIVGALATIRLMTELLSPKEFGEFSLFLGIAALALGLAASPLLQAILRYYPDCAKDGAVSALRALGLRKIGRNVAMAGAAIALVWVACSSKFSLGHWSVGFLIGAVLMVDALRSFELAMLNASRRQREAALIGAADSWLRLLTVILAVTVFGHNSAGALVGYILGTVVLIASVRILQYCMHGRNPQSDAPSPSFRNSSDQLAHALGKYSWPLVPLAIAGWLTGMADRYIIGGVLGLDQVGLYVAVYGLASRPFLSLFAIIESTLRPLLQNAISAGDNALIKRTKRAFLLLTVSSSALGFVCFVLLQDRIGILLLAPEYRYAVSLMPWIALGYCLYSVSGVYTRFCYAHDKTGAVSIITWVGTITGLIILLPAVRLWGLPGAALTVPIQFATQLTISYVLAHRAALRPRHLK